MKIAIGCRIQHGPWGGGNRFVAALAAALREKGHEVVFDLRDSDIDIALLVDPRSRVSNFTFGAGALLRYLMFRNPNAIVVHRINECDERKGTRGMNRRLRLANYCADHTVFVGSWLRDLPVWWREDGGEASVILNGADTRVFHPQGYRPWPGTGPLPLRLATHHWGGNWRKGFDVYQRLDAMLADPAWRARIEFTYIGNLPRGFAFENARYVAPLEGDALADELRSHHVYVTASMNEPGGNHQNEGALCGLPLLYRNSGCLPEYCEGFGVSFDGPEDFETALATMTRDYPRLAGRMADYPHTAEKCTAAWTERFEDLIRRRADIVGNRRLWRRPDVLLLNQIPF